MKARPTKSAKTSKSVKTSKAAPARRAAKPSKAARVAKPAKPAKTSTAARPTRASKATKPKKAKQSARPARAVKPARKPQPAARGGGDKAVLARVVDRIRKSTAAGESPVVVFDLDYTLFDNAPRTLEIMHELGRRHRKDMPWIAKRVRTILASDLPFDHESCLRLLGSEVEEVLPKLKSELGGMFFSSKYLLHDVPYAGGIDYVETCLMAGATIVYMTGRDRIGMYDGTVASLTKHEFPLGHPRVHLVMKPDQVTKDFVFKATLRHAIRDYGTLVAFFDNEPANVNNFKEFYPDIVAVLMDTKHWPGAPEVSPAVEKIKGYVTR